MRQRKEDIPALTMHFVQQFCSENGKPLKTVSKEAIGALMDYEWKGNIRELRNIVERLIIMVESDVIEVHHVLSTLNIEHGQVVAKNTHSLKNMLEDVEKKIILEELERNNGNVTQTAKNLSVDRANLYRKLRLYGILK